MLYTVVFLAAVASGAFAQQSVWGQCGGINWTGPTSCVSGTTCVYNNAYYSQCQPGSSQPTTTTTQQGGTTLTTRTTTTTTAAATGGSGPVAGTIITRCSSPGMIALTFDDGPYTYEDTLVSKLNAAGAKATFFVTGTLYGCIYSRATSLKNAYNSGHQIASHTWTHANLASLSSSQIMTEMSKLEVAFSNILGVKPTYMRPPNGATGGSVVSTMQSMGYRIVTWDIDSGDWNNVGVATSESRFTQAGAGGNGHIPLMHETYASTVNELVPWVINWAKTNNLRMVTVAECVGNAGGAYTSPVAKTGATTC